MVDYPGSRFEKAEKLDALDHRDETLWFTALHALQGDLDEAFV